MVGSSFMGADPFLNQATLKEVVTHTQDTRLNYFVDLVGKGYIPLDAINLGFIMAFIVTQPLVIMVGTAQACINFTFKMATMLSLAIIKVSLLITFHAVPQKKHLTFKINHLLFSQEKVYGIHNESHLDFLNLSF